MNVIATVDMGSVDDVTKALKLGAEIYGRDMVVATKKMTAKIIRSLIASTYISPKRRSVRELRRVKARRRDLKTFRIRGLYGKSGVKEPGEKIIQAKSRENAIKYHATISMRGLAKRTWTMAGKKVSGVEVITVPEAHADTTRVSRKYAKGIGRFQKHDVYVKIENELAYIHHAMKGGGEQAVSSVLDRASASFIADAKRHAANRLKEQLK